MMEEGRYIYCIIEPRTRASTVQGKENKDQRLGYIGINNREVSFVHYKDISAVISPTPVINFDRLDKKELTRCVAVHQKVNEEVMSAKGGDYDVAPMAFGIIAPSPEEVLRILEKAYLQFKMALRKVTGKAEFAIQVRWDPKRVLEELANIDSEIQKLKQKISSKGSILGMPIKLKLGRLIQKKAEACKQEYIKDIHAVLNAIACDVTFNKLIDEDMIVNFSFLMEKIKEPELDKKMQELGKKYEGKLRFKYIGPMPPYSFVNINLKLGNFELVNEARKLLGLKEEAFFNEIKKAYYDLAHQYHPDKHQEDLKKEEQMKKIAQAFSVLESYCQSYNEFAGKAKDRKCSFKEEDVKNSIIIK